MDSSCNRDFYCIGNGQNYVNNNKTVTIGLLLVLYYLVRLKANHKASENSEL